MTCHVCVSNQHVQIVFILTAHISILYISNLYFQIGFGDGYGDVHKKPHPKARPPTTTPPRQETREHVVSYQMYYLKCRSHFTYQFSTSVWHLNMTLQMDISKIRFKITLTFQIGTPTCHFESAFQNYS